MRSRSRRNREAESRRHRARARRRMMLFAGAAAVAAVVALILIGGALRGDDEPITHSAPAEGYILGDPSAPVVIEAWEDFQCPVCKAANGSTLRGIEDAYVSTGKAQLVFRQFPFLGPESYRAAEASQCAADQDGFWEYHDALFTAQGAENSGALSDAKLKEIASTQGLNAEAFAACLDSGEHSESVATERAEGERLGVNSTPTFFVDGERVPDWRDYNGFAALIEAALTTSE